MVPATSSAEALCTPLPKILQLLGSHLPPVLQLLGSGMTLVLKQFGDPEDRSPTMTHLDGGSFAATRAHSDSANAVAKRRDELRFASGVEGAQPALLQQVAHVLDARRGAMLVDGGELTGDRVDGEGCIDGPRGESEGREAEHRLDLALLLSGCEQEVPATS